MRLKIIQKYLIQQIIPQFFLAVFIFSFIVCLVELFTYQSKFSFGFDLWFWSKMIFFLLLQNAVLIIPISFFYAFLVSLGEMMLQNEIIALKSCGFSYFILLKPALYTALFLSLTCFFIGGFLKPLGYKSVKKIFSDFIQKKNVQLIKEGVFNDGFFEYIIYAEKVNSSEKLMDNIILIPKKSSSQDNSVIFARSGKLYQTDNAAVMLFQLNNGSFNHYSDGFQELGFEKASIKLSHSDNYEMGSFDRKKNIISLWFERNQGRGVKMELIKIINDSLLPLVFFIFGFGFFGVISKPNRGFSFLTTIVVISFYYSSEFIKGTGLGPYIEASIPNIVISITGLFFIYRSSKR